MNNSSLIDNAQNKTRNKKKYFLSQQEIKQESHLANELNKQGLLVDKEIPDYWCQGVSQFKKRTNLLFAIFLGIFGVDRFYLKKYISACVKIFLILIVTPLWLWFTFSGVSFAKENLDIIIVFSILFYGSALVFYLGDIIIAIIKPRDFEFKEVKD